MFTEVTFTKSPNRKWLENGENGKKELWHVLDMDIDRSYSMLSFNYIWQNLQVSQNRTQNHNSLMWMLHLISEFL